MITTFLVEPMHPSGLVGVTTYVAVLGTVVGLTSTSVMGAVVPGAVLAVPPVMPPVTVGTGHEKVVPATSGVVVRARFAAVPLQIDCTRPAVTDGVGFTVTTSVEAVPAQNNGVGPVGVST